MIVNTLKLEPLIGHNKKAFSHAQEMFWAEKKKLVGNVNQSEFFYLLGFHAQGTTLVERIGQP